MALRVAGGGSGGGGAPLNSPAFTGTPTAPTNATATDATTQIATDAFVQNAIAAAATSGVVNGGSFAVVPISTTRGLAAQATIPANFLSPTGYMDVYFNYSKSGAVDAVSAGLLISPFGASNFVGNVSNLTTTNNYGEGWCRIYGNGVDQSSVTYDASASNVPFFVITSANGRIARTVNTAAPWVVAVGLSTAANETATSSFMVVVKGGSGAGAASSYPLKTFATIAFSSTPTITYTNYANFDTVLTANTFASTSFTESGLSDGVSWTWTIRQDGTGGWQPAAWPASFFFLTAGGAAPTVPTAATTGILVLSGVYNANFNGGKTLVSVAQQS